MMYYYNGPTRRGAGLKTGELYEVVDSSWLSKVKIRTDTGAEVFIEKRVPSSVTAVPRITFSKHVVPEYHVSSNAIEVRGLGLSLIFKTKKKK